MPAMTIGEKIAQSIKAKGVTKKFVCDTLSISRQTLDNWIKGIYPPDYNDLKELSRILDVDISELTVTARPVSAKYSDPKIPFYDAIAIGGMAALEADQTPVFEPTEMISPGTWFRSATAALRVCGDSMFPKYRPGCVVALKEIFDKDDIDFGQDYVVETNENRWIKRIMKSDLGNEYIELTSYSSVVDTRGKLVHAPRDYPLSKIRRMYKVLGQVLHESGGDMIVHR